ncbi:hypothetical protein Tco_0941346 [Tanacetum coccineum]|uniref:Uncharacterized protein n=1 Tax=Tanacetum coccineum TaxID=301880 RepID=A0ABQ5DQM8_9ASTR
MTTSLKVAVIGAGVGRLTAARELRRRVATVWVAGVGGVGEITNDNITHQSTLSILERGIILNTKRLHGLGISTGWVSGLLWLSPSTHDEFEHEHEHVVIQRNRLDRVPAQSVGSSNTDVLDLPVLALATMLIIMNLASHYRSAFDDDTEDFHSSLCNTKEYHSLNVLANHKDNAYDSVNSL